MAAPKLEQSHVLVVDDDAMLARTLVDVLELHGFAARSAQNGETAIAMARELQPRVAVVDLRLPDMNGLDLASKLHADARDLQIIILTGNASVDTAIRALRDENCDYLIKPIEPAVLVRTMRAADSRHRLKSTEEALRRTQSLVRTVFESSPLPIVVMDANSIVTLWNPSAERLFGWRADEALGHRSRLVAEDDARGVVRERFQAVLRGETFVGLEVQRQTKDGRTLDLRQTMAPIGGAEGKADAVMIVFEDITERRRMDQELRDAQRLDQIGRLAGGVAHDFNNLLAVIMAESEMALGAAGLPDDTRQAFADVLSAAKAGSDLTRQLLSFARRRPVEPVAINPNELIRDVERMFRRLIGERVKLQLELDDTVGVTTADRSQLEQVLANLMVNARDAMPHGGELTLRTRRHLEPAGGRPALERREWIVVSVTDTGTGMSAEVRARLFEPFFTTKPRGKGTGLGLATSYGIVQAAGGTILVESEAGKGSTFEVYLPRTDSKTTPVTEERTAPSGTKPGVVLVVEDQPALRAVARRVLERAGYMVHTAELGASALGVIASLPAPPDAILVDVNLPDGDGRDVVKSVLAKYPGIAPLLTSGAPETIKGLGTEVPLLEKPYSVATLVQAIAAAIERHRR